MHITINQQPVELPENATVADAVTRWNAKPPFAVALNAQFVPRSNYAQRHLQTGDHIEIIAPVTGG